MSYADAAAKNREPASLQPHADTALLNTDPSTEDVSLPSSDSKVTIAPADYKEHPKVAANRIADDLAAAASDKSSGNVNGSQKRAARKERAKETVDEAEEKGLELWEQAKARVLQPGVAGGLLGFVNLAVLGTIGYKLYSEPGLRTDKRFLSTASIGTLVLFGAEGAFAEAYRKTDAGRAEEEKAREEGAALYKQAKNIVLRPGVLGGLAGVINVGILGGVGYWSYTNWDKPEWDRRTVTATTVGILALFTGEGYLGEQYKEKEYPKRK